MIIFALSKRELSRLRREERIENFCYGLAGGILAIVLFITIISWS